MRTKSAFLKDGLRQVRATMTRFFAILIISALGVAFFAGLRASGPDMRVTAADYFDRLNFMDIRLLSGIGFNEDDVEAIKNVEGVASVMPAYSFDALSRLQDKNLTVRLHSLGTSDQDALNRPKLTEGRMPESSGECLADPRFIELSGYRIGDAVQIMSGTSDPVSDAIKTDVFQIVGIAESPLYISAERGSSSVGSGKTDAFLLILPTDFAYTVYTEVYLTVQNPNRISRFDDGYGDLIAPVKAALEETGEYRADLRYEEIRSEAREELDDAKDEVADGYRQLDDAQKELDDARADLNEGWRKYYDGLDTFNKEIADAQKTLDDGQAELEQGWRDYDDGVAEFEQKISDAEQELADGYAKYEDGQREFDLGLASYHSGLDTFYTALKELENGEAAYQQGYAEYTQGVQLHGALAAALDAGNTPEALATVGMMAAQLAETNPELSAVLTAYAENPEDPVAAATAQGAVYQLGQSLEQVGQQLDAAKADLDAGRAQLEAAREELISAEAQLGSAETELADAKRQLDEGSAELEQARQEGQQELLDAKNKLLDAETELADGRATLIKEKAEGEQELHDALQKLYDGEAEYREGETEFLEEQTDALTELEDAEKEIQDGEKELAELKLPEWYVLDHKTNIGFLSYKQDAERIEALSLVVPVLFFLVAVLVTMTSMTRLVDSDRPYIGTMKALGYRNGKIALRYLLYAVSASFLGSVAGLAAGLNIFPRVIFNAYATLYTLPPIQIRFIPVLAVVSVVLAVACAALPAWFVCLNLMRGAPAELMRPAAPNIGKRTLLERVPFIWRKFNFSQKVAIRNLFRYKKRLLMTIIGVAGCTALMFTGFGLRDAVTTIVPKQYDMIQHYDMRIDLQKDNSAADMALLDAAVSDHPNISSSTKLTQEPVDVLKESQIKSAFLTVPETPSEFSSYFSLQDRQTGEPVVLSDDTVLITEKLADMLGLAAGDTIILRNDDGKGAAVTIGGVTENYLYHYIFMSPSLYRSAFESEPAANQVLCHLRDTSQDSCDALSASLLAHSAVSAVTFTSNLKSSAEKMVGALQYVVLVLILSSAALVFVVLFSLTSINLEERSRELATIKVLGFFDRELAAYIYRENVVLTILGTVAGLVLGVVLQRYIISTMEIDMLMFSRDLLWPSYVFSAGLTFFFAALVNLIMFRHIVKIDMVSSLKSIE